MPPMPINEHQDFESDLEAYLREHWAKPLKAVVRHQINLSLPDEEDWTKNYRIPDLLMMTAERYRHINRGAYCGGPPNVVVEIHSPGDEAYDKLDFYAELGVPEVWIINRDSKQPDLFLLKKGKYRKQRATASGWFRSPETGFEMKANGAGKLLIRKIGDESTQKELPEE